MCTCSEIIALLYPRSGDRQQSCVHWNLYQVIDSCELFRNEGVLVSKNPQRKQGHIFTCFGKIRAYTQTHNAQFDPCYFSLEESAYYLERCEHIFYLLWTNNTGTILER